MQMIRMFVREKNGMDHPNILPNQLVAKIRRSINQQVPSGNPTATLHRVLLFFGLSERHTGQPQPMTGTPTLVPVPSKIIWPEKEVV